MQKKAYHLFYFRPAFFWQHLKRMRNWSLAKQYYQGLKYILGILEA